MHSRYSGDIDPGEGASVDELCARAVEAGLTTIAVTDHCDIDGIYEGYFPPLDFEGVRRDVYAAKEKYANRLTLLYGLVRANAGALPLRVRHRLGARGARHHRFCQRGVR